jgi:hypothetical protein
MDRRQMLTEGCRYLAQALPAMAAAAGSLGFLLGRPAGAAVNSSAPCFPAMDNQVVPPISTPLPKED